MSKNLMVTLIGDDELAHHTNRVLGALEHVDIEQGRTVSQKLAIMNVYANTRFLFNAVSDIAAYDLLAEIRRIIKKQVVAESRHATKH